MKRLLVTLAAAALLGGCSLPRESIGFGLRMELGLEERPCNWSHMKDLAFRRAPRVGEPAPDFTLPLLDSEALLTRSTFQDGRPLVLVLASFS